MFEWLNRVLQRGSKSVRPIGFVSHSTYSNAMILEANTEVVWVRGNEGGGRYIEVKDIASGKTVGHRIVPRQ
jgi:hypothetical protein